MIVPGDRDEGGERLRRRWRRGRRLARLALWVERVWPALWPSLGVLGLFLCAALLDLPHQLPGWWQVLLLVAVAAVVAGLALWRLRGVRRPDDAQADRRLERDSGLAHRPLAMLGDAAAVVGDERLWRLHRARVAARIGRLRVGLPHPGLAARDPMALRAGLVVLLIACAVIAGADAPARLARAFSPGFAPAVAAATTELQAWITPPAYTGEPPLFLRADQRAVSVPAGSRLTVNVTGSAAAPVMTLAERGVPFKTLADASFEAGRTLTAGGRLVVEQGGDRLGAWDIAVIADRPPVVRFPAPPGSTDDAVPLVRLPWRVSHAYGVVSLKAELRLRDRPDAPPLEITIPLPGGAPKAAHGVRELDLTPSPWAGLAVVARLVGRDAAGLAGHSADAGFILPERHFSNPVARALMALRRMLTLKPDARAVAVAALDRLAGRARVWRDDPGGFLNLRAIAALLRHEPSAAAIGQAQRRMWLLALDLEGGAVGRTARALAEARAALDEALKTAKPGDKLDQARLEALTRVLQAALDRHLQALIAEAQRNPQPGVIAPDARRLDAGRMRALAEQLRRDAARGDTADARARLAQLEKLLDELKALRPRAGRMSEAERQRAHQRQRGEQQMSVLQDVIQRQGRLLDHADARREARHAAGEAQAGPQRAQDRRVQQALRRVLGELMQQYADLTGKIPTSLGGADTAMRAAAQALAQADDEAAADAQLRAIEALQKGGAAMGRQMALQFGRRPAAGSAGQGQGERGGAREAGRGDPWTEGMQRGPDGRLRDPLGRPLTEGEGGRDDGRGVKLPDHMKRTRVREIQQELRRREAERNRPQLELQYFDRLLRPY